MRLILAIFPLFIISLIACASTATETERVRLVDEIIKSLPADAVKNGPAHSPNGQEYCVWSRKGVYPPEKLAWQTIDKGEIVEMLVYTDGSLHGNQYRWHAGGQLKEIAPYDHGVLNGEVVRWDPAGEVIARFVMDHGTGIEKEYYPSGYLKSETHFKNGVHSGLRVTMHENHRVATICNYENDKAVGLSVAFFDKGDLKWIAKLNQQGEAAGPAAYYHVDGSLKELILCVGNEPVTEKEYQDAREFDASLPPLETDPLAYKNRITDEFKHIRSEYESLAPVPIPLEPASQPS